MKRLMILLAITALVACAQNKTKHAKPVDETLKSALAGKFYIGTAINEYQLSGKDSQALEIVKKQFNSIVAENCMKSEQIQPEQGRFNFGPSDAFVEFGEQNNMFIIGHTLVWHSQAAKWLFVDKNGNDVSRDTLIERMHKHINTIVSRYKGKVKGWDVVNEAINDDGTMRETRFYKIIGPDYIELAFKFAHEADPDAELYYNDYSMPKAEKRDAVVAMVNNLKSKGIKVDGIGMQGHYPLDFPTTQEFEEAILAFASCQVKVMITEMDITVLPWPSNNVTADISLNVELQEKYNPYPNQLPDSMMQVLTKRYTDLFAVLLKHSDVVSRVTIWGVTDANSWRNYWPIQGRTDYPVLFDRNYQPKPMVPAIIEMAKNVKTE